MALTGSLSERFGTRRPRLLIPLRLRALVHAPDLDADLALGIRPSASAVHQLRADHMRRPRIRRRIAAALDNAVDEAHRPVCRRSVISPYSYRAIRHSHRELHALAKVIATTESLPARGLAIAFQLCFDGRGALFFQPDSEDRVERLANTVQTARNAMRVSIDFDQRTSS